MGDMMLHCEIGCATSEPPKTRACKDVYRGVRRGEKNSSCELRVGGKPLKTKKNATGKKWNKMIRINEMNVCLPSRELAAGEVVGHGGKNQI